ncbi:cytochrome c-type biogenesis protein CcmH [Aliiruegeria haliotis]|uniref:Cytochrome c-type biogenesis protein CcmH n=1 Tax=Aliiruegeria haliotis TaxID=1280846 RepID=A0A2T0RVR6_9RHOB|nr:c-type cytochrome biogenesis protein CcmI [Aliiruegeria haliotis]PRY25238.1 cytochrome c-type biogenesis protein CcmH [Aliiruegeria haliotis]
MTFWIVSGALTLLAALLTGWTLLRPRGSDLAAQQKVEIQVYRDQLQAVERDLARGVVTEDEAGRLTTEIKRRILDADKAEAVEAGKAPRSLTFAVAAVSGLVVIGGSFWLYSALGAPGYEDQPLKKRLAEAERLRKDRPSQEEFESTMPPAPAVDVSEEYRQLMEQLRAAVAENPDEVQGWVLLAHNEAQLGNLADAHAAQRRIIELKGDEATAQDYVTYAAILIQAAGGNVSSQADWALNGALSRDPKNHVARYYAGLMHLQTGRPDQTFQFWEPLLRESPPDAGWVPIIRARLESVAALAGINYQLPADPHLSAMAPPQGGPSAEDMAAAADMSPEDRQAFIQNMVDQLGARMAEEGGPPSDWAKLIRAHGVLGNTGRAATIWSEAQRTFSDPADLAPIREAAASAGVDGIGPDGRGPTQEDMDAAADMAPQDRAEMIRGMVDQLGERLATEGGPPQDWARMISALGVLGETERAAAIWEEAQGRFSDPSHLALIKEAAVASGVAE